VPTHNPCTYNGQKQSPFYNSRVLLDLTPCLIFLKRTPKMNMRISTIINYIGFLFKKYAEIQSIQTKNTFRVANIKTIDNATKIIFQVIGKSTFLECTPTEILTNEFFMEGFSKKDIQKITYLHAKNENTKSSPDLKLIHQEYNMTNGKTQFILRNKQGGISRKNAAEVVLDKETIKKLSPQEALNIGYIAGYEHSQNSYEN
jgi:hypothetical protein